jgi:hypothetical protein
VPIGNLPAGWGKPLRLLILLAYGVLNAILYAGLLPLWDGFDEPFHYSYVQQLSRHGRLPVLGRSTLSLEVWDSLDLAPASYLVKRNIPKVIAFNEYFALSGADCAALRRRLEALDPGTANDMSAARNYEAHQPPLAYAILAVFDLAFRKLSLLWRILWLRIIVASVSALATGVLTFHLATRIGLGERWALSAVYLVLSSQMFYASSAHVANDWLAVPLFTLLLIAAISLQTAPGIKTAAAFFVVLAAGLLTKAYFLSMLPFAACLVFYLCHGRRLSWRGMALAATVPMTVAGAWYARNISLYHDLSAMQETAGRGVPVFRMVRVLPRLPWIKVIDASATTSLWTGNNSATTFSSRTIHFMLLLLLGAALLYIWSLFAKSLRPAEWLVLGGCISYASGVLYSTVLSYAFTGGVQISPSPWYLQPLFPPGICLCMLGLTASRRIGNLIRIAMLGLWTYVISATYLVKLIPLYAGYQGTHNQISSLLRWYISSFDAISRALSTTIMINSTTLWVLLVLVIAGAVVSTATLARLPETGQRAYAYSPPLPANDKILLSGRGSDGTAST